MTTSRALSSIAYPRVKDHTYVVVETKSYYEANRAAAAAQPLGWGLHPHRFRQWAIPLNNRTPPAEEQVSNPPLDSQLVI